MKCDVFTAKLNLGVMQSLRSDPSVSEPFCRSEKTVRRRLPGAEVLTHLMGCGSCFHTYSVWKTELKQEIGRQKGI